MQHSAPVYSFADEQREHAEAAAWTHFTAPREAGEFHAAWLTLLAARVARARAALLLTREAGTSTYVVSAAWPDPRRDLQYLGPVAQQALEGREGVVVAPGGTAPPRADGAAHVAYPLNAGGELLGAVVFDIGPGALADLQGALRQIHWGSAWLLDHFRQQTLALREAELARSTLLNQTLATALQHARLQPSALAVANELAGRLGCDRVSVGFETAGRVEPLAMSNTASFDARSDLVRWLGEAMDEVLDLGTPVAFPAAGDDEVGALAHAESARRLALAAMLSVPIRHGGETLGAITLERNQGPAFSADERTLAAALGVVLGPAWALLRANERGIAGRARDLWRDTLHQLAGPAHPGLKLGGALLAGLLLVSALWHIEYRVPARTVVEGATQLAAVAPFDGFIAQGLVRAGDTVRQGQALARLDDRDLQLERSRWSADLEQLRRRHQVAQASADRAAMGVLAAQMNQTEAQLVLAEERIARATLTAPFDGIVVSGDLSQQIGSSVETGKLLFEVASLEGYRVMLEVDDRDITYLRTGQRGELVLSGLPNQRLPIAVRRLTPVAVQKDGRNLFTVEAAVTGTPPAGIRPGMEGVGKVEVGQRSLLWIWTHSFVDWLRLTLWNWTP